ncbi:probable beta-D-xylosidase 5 isoform X1 [Tripterygium wilfordii]|uniref:probable beta-D-xylosidase 5 isoform X1 n=1 Tax=Tripterygium wilfordii TaxID=458696 RepID=UPI0018F80AD4|nr:probable beta-D-xylosidase 5 isoform X1 [Tripterygium wilfordii]
MKGNAESELIGKSIFLFSIAFASARPSKTIQEDLAAPSADQGPTHVCHASRFADLGLDMADYIYCDSSLPFDVRAKDLVDRMTLNEKVEQVGNLATGVPRIGLLKYQWWSEALHGVSNVGPGTFFDDTIPGATSFPTVILSAAAFNQSLWKSIGQAVSTEARAMYNLGKAGLTYWSPNINVVRDPRWGRAIETPGEDPYVVGTFATNYVRGLQDVPGTENTADLNSRPLKVSSCCKHYAAYDVDAWKGVDRYHFDARVSEQDMKETFLRPFEMCVKDGDVSSVMCSYNRVNGIPACADPYLLKNTIRGEWDLHGYIVSDCDSIEVMHDDHKWLGDSKEDAVAQVLKAGLDLDCGDYYTKALGNSVRQGEVKEADLDKSLKYLYVVLMRLGFFDGSPQFNSLGKNDVCSDANLELATEAAREGIVLLKNDNKTLPLKSCDISKIAVIGPHAKATSAMIGNYAGIPCGIVTPFDGISKYGGEVTYEKGCSDVACKDDSLIFSAMNAAKNADATILLVGLDLSVEAESLDRNDLLLPGYQTQLINQVAESSSGPLVVVIMSAGGIDISFAKNNPKIKAILWAGYPGEKGGRAIADVIFGKYNPGGRLPLTWYEAGYVDMLPMTSMPLRPVDSLGYPGRTYKFFNGSTVYPFGYGLSYTNFSYSVLTSPATSVKIKLNKFQHCRNVNYSESEQAATINNCPAVVIDDLECGYKFGFEVAVENVGKEDGSDVVMVYSKPPEGIVGSHSKQLIGFEREFVKSGETKVVKFEFDACKSLNIVDTSGYNLLPSGGHIIMVGEGDNVISFPLQLSYYN